MYEGIRSQLEQANVIKYYDDGRQHRMQLEQEMERFGFEEKNRELYRKVLLLYRKALLLSERLYYYQVG